MKDQTLDPLSSTADFSCWGETMKEQSECSRNHLALSPPNSCQGKGGWVSNRGIAIPKLPHRQPVVKPKHT